MKLKQFYDTLNKDIPFNELSVERMDILEQSDAYKRWLANYDSRIAIVHIKLSKIRSIYRLQDTQKKAMNEWFDNLKYIGNILLCGFMAMLIIMFVYWHIFNNA